MADFEQAIEQAIVEQEIPGCTLHAINRDGKSPATLQAQKNPVH